MKDALHSLLQISSRMLRKDPHMSGLKALVVEGMMIVFAEKGIQSGPNYSKLRRHAGLHRPSKHSDQGCGGSEGLA
jgi:hypothetical protein